jgi:hypothetical protein
MTFLESIGLTSSPRVIPKTPAPEPNGKKSGTPAYKYSLVYIYCDVADHERAKMLAKELGIPMKVLIHRLLFAAEIAVPNKTKVTVLNGKAFWEMFDVPGLKEPVEEKFNDQPR